MILVSLLVAGLALSATWTKEQAVAIINKAEKIRAPDTGESDVLLTSVSKQATIEYQLAVLIGKNKRAFIDFIGPEKERGRKLLLQGKNYWTKFRNTKKVIPIGRREAIGNSSFAIADVFQIDTEEYDPTVVGEETEQNKRILKVHLDARHKDAPYASIDYFVTADDHFPVKALFYGVSGKHLKTLTVETSKEMGGMLRVETMRMSDAVLTDRYSIWHTKTLTLKEIPDQVFSKDYMMRQ